MKLFHRYLLVAALAIATWMISSSTASAQHHYIINPRPVVAVAPGASFYRAPTARFVTGYGVPTFQSATSGYGLYYGQGLSAIQPRATPGFVPLVRPGASFFYPGSGYYVPNYGFTGYTGYNGYSGYTGYSGYPIYNTGVGYVPNTNNLIVPASTGGTNRKYSGQAAFKPQKQLIKGIPNYAPARPAIAPYTSPLIVRP